MIVLDLPNGPLLPNDKVQLALYEKSVLATFLDEMFGPDDLHPLNTFSFINAGNVFHSEWIPVGGVINVVALVDQLRLAWPHLNRFVTDIEYVLSQDQNHMQFLFSIKAIKIQA